MAQQQQKGGEMGVDRGFVGGGGVNLLRDLEVLLEVRPGDGGSESSIATTEDSGAGGGGVKKPQIRRRRGAAAVPGRKYIPAGASKLDLKDPELYQALMKECLSEERMAIGREYIAPPFVTNYLIRNDVRPLKKRSQRFPKAQYYCRLCDYHCDTLTICISHIKDERHSRLARMQEVETTLYHLPKPSKQHLDYLEQLLAQLQKELGLTQQDIKVREEVAEKVHALLEPIIKGSSVRLYGSCMTGFGLKTSLLNLDLQIPDDMPQHLALVAALETISANPQFSNVSKDFCEKIPKIFFSVDGLRCELCLNNHHAYQTSALLRDYLSLDPRAQTLATAVRHWASLCQLDNQCEGTMPAHAFALLLVFFLQQETKPVLPCIHDYLESRDVDTYKPPTEKLQQWKTRNTKTSAELLIEFFEFYALGFRLADYVVCVRNVGGYTKNEKQWKGKKLAIEDPFSPKRNLTRSVNSLSILDYITDCLKIAYLYFGTIQTTQGPVITKILVPDAYPELRATPTHPDEVGEILTKLNLDSTNLSGALPPSAIKLEELEQSFNDDEEESEEDDEDENLDSKETFESFIQKHGRELTPKQAKKVTELVPKNMIRFVFDADILTAGQSPGLSCVVCGNEGHLQSNCPDENLPPLRPLPPLHPNYKQQLDSLCKNVMRQHEPLMPELNDRSTFIKDLTRFIQRTHPKAQLTVFGSSYNGFAFANSDLDISLTFSDHQTDENIDAIDIIEKLAEKLKRMTGIRNVQAITSAKVPIIKFTSVKYQSRIEGDISLYNILAQVNTEMLRLYSTIDERVKILGYMAKLFAKRCDIGDASRGSLSSYAYILMLLHYLQQCNPPVVPVLQELHPPGTKPKNMVDGWNAWFFDDARRLHEAWPGLGLNRQPVTELWIGFLQYYAETFDDKNLVVCTRQLRPLTKFEKMWNSKCIAIEDPFDLDHNLGAGISRKMNLYIKKAFMLTRDRFGFPPLNFPSQYNSLQDYLWDPHYLTDGQPPNDRGCRACGKIGHIVRDCPRKKNYEDRRKKEIKHRAAIAANGNNGRIEPSGANGNMNHAKSPTKSPSKGVPPPAAASNATGASGEPGVDSILSMLTASAVGNSFQLNPSSLLPPPPTSAISLADLERSFDVGRDAQQPPPPPGVAGGLFGPPGFAQQTLPPSNDANAALKQLRLMGLLPPENCSGQTRMFATPPPVPLLPLGIGGLGPIGSGGGPPLSAVGQQHHINHHPFGFGLFSSGPPPLPTALGPLLTGPFGNGDPAIAAQQQQQAPAKPLQLNDMPHLNLFSQIRPTMPPPSSPGSHPLAARTNAAPRHQLLGSALEASAAAQQPLFHPMPSLNIADPFQRHWQP